MTFAGRTPQQESYAPPDIGRVEGGHYVNDTFGLTLEFPAEWDVATRAENEQILAAGSELRGGNHRTKAAVEASKKHSFPLLTVVEPQAAYDEALRQGHSGDPS